MNKRFVEGLMGANNWEAALCDQMVEYMNDLLVEIAKVHYAEDDKKVSKTKEIVQFIGSGTSKDFTISLCW